VEIPTDETEPENEALEQLIADQALNTALKPAILACLTGGESRRWTIAELYDRLNNLGVRCSKPGVLGALGELELEISLCRWLPWFLVEHGTEWSLRPRNEVLGLLCGVRKLPVVCAESLTVEEKAVLFVVLGHRRKGGVSKTRIGQILGLDAEPHLAALAKEKLIYVAPGKELNWWRPSSRALLALGVTSRAEIPELTELEAWFDSQQTFGTHEEKQKSVEPILQTVLKRGSKKQRRQLEQRASTGVIRRLEDAEWKSQEIGDRSCSPAPLPSPSPAPPSFP
jgi:hypothetical protein